MGIPSGPCTPPIFRTNVRAHRPPSSRHPCYPLGPRNGYVQAVLFSLLPRTVPIFGILETVLGRMAASTRLCDRSSYRPAGSRDPRLVFLADIFLLVRVWENNSPTGSWWRAFQVCSRKIYHSANGGGGGGRRNVSQKFFGATN